MSDIESIYNKWLSRLQLEQFHIRLHLLNEMEKLSLNKSGYKAKIRWNYNENIWELLIPRNIERIIIIHELGHLFFPKEVNDLNLTPRLKIQEDKNKIDSNMMFILNQLTDIFVNYYLSRFNDYYDSWFNLKKNYLDLSLNFSGKPLFYIIAFYLLHYVDYNYIFKKSDKLELISKINSHLIYTENMILSRSKEEKILYNRTKLINLKTQLDQFNIIKDIKDSKRIILFMFQIIIDLSLWNKDHIINQFKMRFSTEF